LRHQLLDAGRYPRRDPRDGWRNRLIHGDLAAVLPALQREFKNKINVIYVDPPFDTGDVFSCKAMVGSGEDKTRAEGAAYEDRWGAKGGYLAWLRGMLEGLVELLHPRGSLFVHLDWRASHHARLLLDELLTPRAFRAEIIWRYRRWPTRTSNLQRMHDTILYYASGPDAVPVFHTLYESLAPSTLRTFGTRKQRADFSSGERRSGMLAVESPGVPLSDVWDISIVAPSGKERVGYPTQKPEALLERILRVASDEGDLVLDCCCGSGTTLVVAERLGRRWVGCDVGGPAVQTTLRRLLSMPGLRPMSVQRVGEGGGGARGRLRAQLRAKGLEVEVKLVDYEGPGGKRGLGWLGAWAIDGLGGERFEADGWFGRPFRRAPLPGRAVLTFRRAGVYQVVLRAIDLLGNEAQWEGEIEVPGFRPGRAVMR
jgi:site-specific DNA-methyltransferase (adenine-specific)